MNALDEMRAKTLHEVSRLVRYLINESLVKMDDMHDSDAPDEAMKVIAALRARVGELERERDDAKSEARFLSGVIAGMENTDNEIIQAVTALVNEWRYLADNKPMPTDRAIGYETCADELAAALAKGGEA